MAEGEVTYQLGRQHSGFGSEARIFYWEIAMWEPNSVALRKNGGFGV